MPLSQPTGKLLNIYQNGSGNIFLAPQILPVISFMTDNLSTRTSQCTFYVDKELTHTDKNIRDKIIQKTWKFITIEHFDRF